jgi:glycosyltransferase involved in cell wall biosynthesis
VYCELKPTVGLGTPVRSGSRDLRAWTDRGELIRIAHFLWGRCNPDSANGVDKTVYYLARAQAEAGHDVAIFSINDKPPIPVPGCEVKSYPVRRLPLPFKKGRLRDLLVLRSPLNLPPSLTKDLLSWQPSIVHFHFVHLPQAILLARRLRELGTAYCVSPHGGLAVQAQHRRRLGKAVFGRLFERRYLNRAAFIHAISAEDLEGTRAYGVHNRSVIAPNGIDPALLPGDLDHGFVRRRLPLVTGKRLFAYIGRIDPQQKGLDLLIEAWAGVSSRDSGRLLLVGPDWRHGRSRLEAMASGLGVADSVLFVPPVAGKEKWDTLAGADVFVHPSRWEAGVPFSALEAMLASKPLLLTLAADPDGRVSVAGAGVTVSPTLGEIRDGLSRMLKADTEVLEGMGASARGLVDREFRWERTSGQLIDAYEQAVAQSP